MNNSMAEMNIGSQALSIADVDNAMAGMSINSNAI
jgi:hypothetical protein